MTYESIAQKVQADLKKINIDVQLHARGIPDDDDQVSGQKDRTAVISYNAPDYLGPSDWADQMILGTWAPRLHYDSKAAQDLAKQADAESDPQKRIPLYQQMLQLLVDEGPYVMLVQGKVQSSTRSNIQGYAYLPDRLRQLPGSARADELCAMSCWRSECRSCHSPAERLYGGRRVIACGRFSAIISNRLRCSQMGRYIARRRC